MKLQKILSRLQKLHPKEIDLSLERCKELCKKLGNPQDKIEVISVLGTNGKNSTISAMLAILKEAKFNCNVYTSPHILKINERFVFNNKELSDDELANLFEEVEDINNNKPITFFEILTASYFYKAAQYPENINLIEAGLFHRFDATNILKKNLASVICSCSIDHTDWLSKNEQTIEKIVFEKTSSLLNSKIIISNQNSSEIINIIKNNISHNSSKKIIYNEDFSCSENENGFIYYEDKIGGIKLPKPNILGEFQIDNIAAAIATLRNLDFQIQEDHIKKGITKIKSIARLQEIKTGKLKDLCKNNKIFVDGSHNPLGAVVLNNFIDKIHGNVHVILGMMNNKDHLNYISYFKNISSLITVDIKNQPNSIKGIALKEKLKHIKNISYKSSIEDAIKSVALDKDDIILITGSLYLAGEVLNLN
mgnify:CR=1 FL=1